MGRRIFLNLMSTLFFAFSSVALRAKRRIYMFFQTIWALSEKRHHSNVKRCEITLLCSWGLTTTALFLLHSLRQWLNKDMHAVFFPLFSQRGNFQDQFYFACPLFILKRRRVGKTKTTLEQNKFNANSKNACSQ